MKDLLKSGGKLHWIKNLYLRYRDGAGCCDAFSIYTHMAPYIARWLRAFRKQNEKLPGHPSTLGSLEEWQGILDEMIWSFDYAANADDWEESYEVQMANAARSVRGFELFGKYYRDLWN